MPDVFEVADRLVSHAVDAHGDDVDLVAYYGSRAQGVARGDSDLDIFYVPREGTNPPVARTFLLEGRLFDFWGIRWETLKGFATGRLRGWAFAPALVHHARPLHFRSDAQASRLAEVQQLVLDRMRPEARPRMLSRALEMFPSLLADLGNVRLAAAGGSISDVRYAGWQVIQSAIECLALANQTFFDRGVGVGLGQLERLEHRPPEMDRQIAAIGASADVSRVVDSCEEIVLGTRRVLRRLQREIPAKTGVEEQFRRAYPEIKDMITKLLDACAHRDKTAAGIGAWFLQSDLSTMLSHTEEGPGHRGFDLLGEMSAKYVEIGLPDLLGSTSRDLDARAEQARGLDERLRRWLTARGVDLCEYETLDELRRSP